MSTPTRIISEQTRRMIQSRDTIDVPVKSTKESVTQLIQTKYELGDLLVSYLEQLSVEYVFGIPGGAIEPLFNALARSERRGGIRSVVARHETGAAFMADGYARNSGKLGVCCGTAGPGTTNLITGVASAYDNHSPLLVITAQTAITNFGKRAAQESGDTGINTVAMFEHCTHYSTLVSHADQFERKLTSAIMKALQSPKGPVHLSIPLDVFRSDASVKRPSYELNNLFKKTSLVDDDSLNKLNHELLENGRTVFIVGEQCADAISYILDVALMLNIEIVTTPHAKGLVSPYHPLFRGVIGFAGHQSAVSTINRKDTDLIVAIGTTLSETASNNWDESVLNSKLIHVDAADCNFAGSPMARLHVHGDIDAVFEKVLDFLNVKLTYDPSFESRRSKVEELEKLGGKGEIANYHFSMENDEKCIDDSAPLKPQRLMNSLPKLFPPNTHYLCDSGNSMVWSIHYLHPYDRRVKSRRSVIKLSSVVDHQRTNGRRSQQGSLFWTCLEYGSMGWAIGSSIGTALSNKNDPVVCITGDGSILMSGGEVTVALQEKLNVVFLILNDAEYGMVKQGQRMGSGEPTAHTLTQVDFVKWGESMGIPGFYVKTVSDLESLNFADILSSEGPVILDVYIDSEEIPPIRNRLQALGAVD
ncbi:MAG: thiamine pyrophosphate-binding protein [Gammaproteobacteria bacterium]|nr:thiamine pyrophosphate-binding protein [Gammaproteobacteria bacterium]